MTKLKWTAVVAVVAFLGSGAAWGQSDEALKIQSGLRFSEGVPAPGIVQQPADAVSAVLNSAQAVKAQTAAASAAAKAPAEPPAPGKDPLAQNADADAKNLIQKDPPLGPMLRFSKWLDKVDDRISIVGHWTGLRVLAVQHPYFLGGVILAGAVATGGLLGGGIGLAVGITAGLSYVSGIFQGGFRPQSWKQVSSQEEAAVHNDGTPSTQTGSVPAAQAPAAS